MNGACASNWLGNRPLWMRLTDLFWSIVMLPEFQLIR